MRIEEAFEFIFIGQPKRGRSLLRYDYDLNPHDWLTKPRPVRMTNFWVRYDYNGW